VSRTAAIIYGRFFDRLWSYGWWPQLTLLLVVCIAAVSLSAIRFDMSFRPLFVDDGKIAALTDEFEEEFGQISGAWIAAILVGGDWRSPADGALLARITEGVASLPHVAEVISLYKPQAAGSLPPVAQLLTKDARSTVILARLDLPLADLAGRRPVIAAFRAVVSNGLPEGVAVHFTGVSVVEDVYATEVLKSLAVGVGLTITGVALMLWLLWGSMARVLVAMAGTSGATILVLGLMAATGQAITLISSMVPTVIMVIGVADAIHMVGCFDALRRRGRSPREAARLMVQEMAIPCLLTTLTTIGGFIALRAADLPVIREFGIAAVIGIAFAYLCNQVLVPYLVAKHDPVVPVTQAVGARAARRWSAVCGRFAIARAGTVIVCAAVLVVVGLSGLDRLQFDQRFNNELGPGHPVAVDQRLFERDFGGLLGPELVISRRDGQNLLTPESNEALQNFCRTLATDQRVLSVICGSDQVLAHRGASPAAKDPQMGLMSADGRRMVAVVRVGDLGTSGAASLVEHVRETASAMLGPYFELRVVGQWWLAQRGMAGLIDDMVRSFVWAFVLIAPLVLIGLRQGRLALVSVLPNLVPLVVAIGFMAWAGISVRIGTAMVLAIALGIAVDDSLHVLARYRQERCRAGGANYALARTLGRTGPALIATTAVLTVGFLSMLSSGLVAIRDMGMVATVTLIAALFSDLLLLPAQIALLERYRRRRSSQRTAVEGLA